MSKKIKRALAWIMVLALVVGFIPAQSASAAANPKLNATKKTITIGDTAALKVQNKIAGSRYEWSTSNKKIATVTSGGKVTAVKKGNATISCKVTAGKKTYNLKCAVTVSTDAVVSTQANLNKALKNDKVTKVTVKTSAARKFNIPAGNYGKKTLVMNAPKSDVTNRGVFKSITIQAIKANTWTERAVGNNIKVTASNASIVVGAEGNVASLNLAKNDANVSIRVNGEVESLVVSREAKVDLTANGKIGEVELKAPATLAIEGKTDKIELIVSEAAKGAEVKTSVPVEAKVSANIDLKLEKGAEGSSVDKTSQDVEVKVDNQTSASVDVTTGGTDKKSIDAGKEGTVGGGDTAVTTPNNSGGGNDTPSPTPTPEAEKKLSYDGYELKWEDQFDGDDLDRDVWNVEVHDPGWVNNELQAYVDSSENIYIEDGKLVLKPVKTEDESGNVSYTSGRVNTQNKKDFKYGLFEARIKVPKGQGFLPAFWMMPTNENLYGQWPRCGEIDIMEVLGNKTDTSYGTIHYGNPHSESQGKYTLKTGTFAEEYHDFAVEWEPGKISWYVDGKLIHTESDWYSATVGQGEITYPAPFDQPFYVILNLAVGGNWPGNPDDTTDIENAALSIDYVKVYQKDSYDENVKKPVKEVILREPDANGNYIINGNFAVAEDLTDDKDWKFLTALGGEAEAVIRNNELSINTTKEGTVNYSVQLVQPNLPMKKGATYKVSFDAYADEARSMIVDVSAPDRSYRRYLADTTVELTTEKQTYTYEFTMKDNDDANGRLEFNLGAAGSTAGVKISNVSLIKTGEFEIKEDEKGILADGNFVYNGGFQEGTDRMRYWEVTNNAGAEISVTNENNIRRLKVVAAEGTSAANPVIISQSDLALSAGNTYAMSFSAEGETGKEIKVEVAGHSFKASLTGAEQTYNDKFKVEEEEINRDIVFVIEEPGTFYLDDICIVEDSLIKNGSFNAGFAGYEVFVDGGASATYVVDSLTEDNTADFTINNTGTMDWQIQLKQNNVELEKDQWYRLSLDAKSDMTRKLMFAIQRDGSSDNDWTPYSGQKIVELSEEYQNYVIEFQMKNETDLKSILSISMGAVDNIQITERHRICIDNINLEKIDAPAVEDQPIGENILKNSDFAAGAENWEYAMTSPGEAAVSFNDNKVVYAITNVGTADWNVQLKQAGITLEKGCSYRVTFKASSTEARTIKLAMLSQSFAWYGGADIALEKDQEQEITVNFTMKEDTDMNTTMVVSMGVIDGIETPASTVCLSGFSLVKTE